MAKFIDIEKYLQGKGIDFKVIDLSAVAISVADVVRLSGGQIREEEIIKTLVVKTRANQFIGCILRGSDRMKKEIYKRLATQDEVMKIAGVDFGAVCPILLGIPILIDARVAQLKRVNMGSGNHLKGLEMNFEDLLQCLPGYKIEEISI